MYAAAKIFHKKPTFSQLTNINKSVFIPTGASSDVPFLKEFQMIAISTASTLGQKFLATAAAIVLAGLSYLAWVRFESTSTMPGQRVSITLFTTQYSHVVKTNSFEKALQNVPSVNVSLAEFQNQIGNHSFAVLVPQGCYELDQPGKRNSCGGYTGGRFIEYLAYMDGLYLRANTEIQWASIDGWNEYYSFDGRQFISTPFQRSVGWQVLTIVLIVAGTGLFCGVCFQQRRR